MEYLMVKAERGKMAPGTLTPFRSEITPAFKASMSAKVGLDASTRKRTFPSSINKSSPTLIAAKISGCSKGTRLNVPGVGSKSRRSFCPMASDSFPSTILPRRSFGPCKSIRIVIGLPTFFSRSRMAATDFA